MYHYKNGNIIDFKGPIAISVNCMGVLDKSDELNGRSPHAFQKYYDYCQGRDPLGSCCVEDDIAYLFTQYDYGDYPKRLTNYEAVYCSLVSFRKLLTMDNEDTFAIPWQIACDPGGAEWQIVLSMIETIFPEEEWNIYFYDINNEFKEDIK